ncbi:MAG: hypothetical protein K2N63_07420, partial [Lachnospiraceae bacterium]|nr:hypothetical protein [Lachnospiraceae bacterium]
MEDLARHLNGIATAEEEIERARAHRELYKEELKKLTNQDRKNGEIIRAEKNHDFWDNKFLKLVGGVSVKMNQPVGEMRYAFSKGEFVLGYYKADRTFWAEVTKHIEKVDLKENYAMTENTRKEFVKYLADSKVTAALARNHGNEKKADKINSWFLNLEDLLKKIFDDASLKLVFDEDSYNFEIKQNDREAFD